MLPADLPWPEVLHSALHHTTIHLLNHTCVASFSTCLYLSLIFPISSFGACSGCCSLFPLLAATLSHCGRREHALTSPSLTAGTSKLQDGKPACTAKLSPSWEKDSSSHAEGRKAKKSETEVHPIFNITFNVTLSSVLKELPGSLISEEPVKFMVVQLHGHLASIMMFSLDFTCTATLSLQPSPFPSRRG